MQKAFNFLRGSVQVEAEGLSASRFANLCAANGIAFWDLTVSQGKVVANLSRRSYKTLADMAEQRGFVLACRRERGVPKALARLRKRMVLVVALLLCMLGLWASSLFIWEIQVVGNETVSSGEILAALQAQGVGIGTFSLTISPAKVRNHVLLEVEELAWMTIQVQGTRALVVVQERTEKSDMVAESVPAKLVATKTGMVETLRVYEGQAVVQEGEIVFAGQELVTGALDSLSSGRRYVHALGEIYARTWYNLQAAMPLESMEKQYTGEVYTRRTLVVGNQRIFLSGDPSHGLDLYDKITEENWLTLPGGSVLPICIETETYQVYEMVPSEMDTAQAEAMLQAELLGRLQDIIGEGTITTADYVTAVENGVITVTLQAECREDIAGTVALTNEEMVETGEENQT